MKVLTITLVVSLIIFSNLAFSQEKERKRGRHDILITKMEVCNEKLYEDHLCEFIKEGNFFKFKKKNGSTKMNIKLKDDNKNVIEIYDIEKNYGKYPEKCYPDGNPSDDDYQIENCLNEENLLDASWEKDSVDIGGHEHTIKIWYFRIKGKDNDKLLMHIRGTGEDDHHINRSIYEGVEGSFFNLIIHDGVIHGSTGN